MEFLFILPILYTVTGLALTIKEYQYIKYVRAFKMSSLFRLLFILGLCFIPAIIIYGYDSGKVDMPQRYSERIWTLYLSYLATLIVYIMFQFGYRVKTRRTIQRKETRREKILLNCFILTFISLISLLIWASGFGGVNTLIENANSIRAGFIGAANSLAFFKHFVLTSMISSLWIYSSFLTKETEIMEHKVISLALFAVSTMVTFLFILANDGRMLAGIYGLLYILIWFKNAYERKERELSKLFFILALAGIIAIMLIINADSLFKLIKGEEIANTVADSESALEVVEDEFSFITSSAQFAIETRVKNKYPLTIGNDLINGIFAWLPTSLKPIELEDVWDINTALINSGSYGQAPCSIVAQSIYDLGFMGVFIIPMLYGILIKKFENLFEEKNSTFSFIISVVLGFYLAKGAMYFSISNIMLNSFFILVGCVVHYLIGKITLRDSY